MKNQVQPLLQPATTLLQPNSRNTQLSSSLSAESEHKSRSISQSITQLLESNTQQSIICQQATSKTTKDDSQSFKCFVKEDERLEQENFSSITTQHQEDPKKQINSEIAQQQQQQQQSEQFCLENQHFYPELSASGEIHEGSGSRIPSLQTCSQSNFPVEKIKIKKQQSCGMGKEGSSVWLNRQRSSDAHYYPKTFKRSVFFSYFLERKLERVYRRWYSESQWGSDIFYRCLTIVLCLAMVSQATSCQQSQVVVSNILATTFLEGVVLAVQLNGQEMYLEYRSKK
eukprot:TRINITY_DN1124_c1_g1_i16.p1 TRINITY_DN1124_c1_g1~~TRINITY_DN1124_c1_g1_i16.p1  ORF type:complete len:294 (-),score=22.06 TRINITY_DN1124_c1_g1_i16:27-881(-)